MRWNAGWRVSAAMVVGVLAVPSAVRAQVGGARLRRTVVVSAVPGNPPASGAALVSALAGITDASAANPYLLKIEPGVYELPQSLDLKAHVDVEGSGEAVTTIGNPGGFPLPELVSAIGLGAGAGELRALTIAGRSGDTSGGNTIGFYALESAPRLSNVTIAIEGTGNHRPVMLDRSSCLMRSVTVRSVTPTLAIGVSVQDASTLALENVDVAMSGAAGQSFALYVTAGSTATLRGGRVSGSPAFEDYGTLRAGATLVDGTIDTLPGAQLTCVGAFDAAFAPLGPDCR